MIICKEFTFDAAHKMENYNSKCGKLHGHTYKLQICLKAAIKEDGLALNLEEYTNFKDIVSKKIVEALDHTYINDVIGKSSSLENLIVWIWDQLKESLSLYEIKLWETPTTFAIYSGSE